MQTDSVPMWDEGAFSDIPSHNTIKVMFPQNPRQYHQQCDTHIHTRGSPNTVSLPVL